MARSSITGSTTGQSTLGKQGLRVQVVGGGAAGYFGAIACAQAHPQAQVTLLEAGAQPLAKVRISGGGRCNVTHHCFDPVELVRHYPRGAKALRGAFSRFQPQDTIAWFQSRGVPLKTEPDGRVFPRSDRSATIIDCLHTEALTAGVTLRTGAAVVALVPPTDLQTDPHANPQTDPQSGFRLQLRSGEWLTGDRVLLATGSSPAGYRLAQTLGHTLIPPVPSLFTFQIRDPHLHRQAGVTVPQVRLRLGGTSLEQTGPLLITHWGLSGPAVLKLSAWGARFLHDARYRASLTIHWLPTQTPETLRQTLLEPKATPATARKSLGGYRPVDLPQRLWEYLLGRSGLDPATRWADLSKEQVNRLVRELTEGSYAIEGKGAFKEEFVTCGGVSLKEVNFKTLESRRCPGLYFAGEILDIDGITGGFNFQNAWTTGWIAGQSLGAA